MRYRREKFVLVFLISSTLLYYSAAWAVLGCFHADDHAVYGTLTSTHDSFDLAVSLPLPVEQHAVIECTGLRYHVEALAAPASSAETNRLASAHRLISSQFISPTGITTATNAFRLIIRVQWRAPLTLSSEIPLYLSLAFLRI